MALSGHDTSSGLCPLTAPKRTFDPAALTYRNFMSTHTLIPEDDRVTPRRAGACYIQSVKPSVIVWDLETVPDLGGFAAAQDLVGKSDVEVREAIGDKFPKHIYHSIVCIGALIAHREPDHWAVDAVGAPTWARGQRSS